MGAHSPLVFGTARDLLKSYGAGADELDNDAHHGAVLLQVSGDQDALARAVLDLVFSEVVVGDEQLKEGFASLSSLFTLFKSEKHCLSADFLEAMQRLRCSEASGTSLDMFLLGLGELLPVTRTGLRAEACSAEYVPMLLCQVLERLFFPMSEVTLLLRIRCPVDVGHKLVAERRDDSATPVAQESEQQPAGNESAAAVEASDPLNNGAVTQPKEFVEALRCLETDGLLKDSKPFDLWALNSGGNNYVLLME